MREIDPMNGAAVYSDNRILQTEERPKKGEIQ